MPGPPPTRNDLPAGFNVPRRTWYLGKWIRGGGWYPDYTVRLFDRRKGRFQNVAVHESVDLTGSRETLSGDILHFSYRNISDHLHRIDRYTDLIADQWVDSGRPVSLVRMVFRPMWEFFRKLSIRRGFVDGIPGVIVAGIHSYYVFLKYAKTFERRLNKTFPPDRGQ